ncbi:MAG: AI-2E family transporter [Aeromicrobium sp.]
MAEQKRIRDRGVVIDEGLGVLQKWGWRIIVLAGAGLVLGWIIGHTWVVIFPVAMALIVTTILGPPAAWLRSKGWPDPLAAAAIMLGFLGAIVGIIAILTPQVAGQAGEVATSASDGLQKVRDWLTSEPLNLSDGQITRAIEAMQDKVQSSATSIGSGIFSTIGAATSAIVNLILILMLTFFFVKDGHKFLPWVKVVAGQRAGGHFVEVAERAWATLGGFIRVQSLVALIDAVIIGAGLAILGSPLAIPLAVVTFFAAFIPIIGAFVSGALAVLVTLVTNDPKDALIALAIVVGVQQLEGNVLSPMLQGKTVNLHPAVVLLGVAAGGTLFGVTGAFLAVPVVATTAEVLRYLNEGIDDSVAWNAPERDDEAAEILDDD